MGAPPTMGQSGDAMNKADEEAGAYALERQVGFLLRKTNQRHTAIFARRMIEDVTPTQWATLAKLNDLGPCSQNLLGRRTAMDAATIKGVVDRLIARGLVEARADAHDQRRRAIALTAEGAAFVARALPHAQAISEETLAPLDAVERTALERLLEKLS